MYCTYSPPYRWIFLQRDSGRKSSNSALKKYLDDFSTLTINNDFLFP